MDYCGMQFGIFKLFKFKFVSAHRKKKYLRTEKSCSISPDKQMNTFTSENIKLKI